jgi:hypothetical protein
VRLSGGLLVAEIICNAISSHGRFQSRHLITVPRSGSLSPRILEDFFQLQNIVGQDKHTRLLGMLWRSFGGPWSSVMHDRFNLDGQRKSEASNASACPSPKCLLTDTRDEFTRLLDVEIRLLIGEIDIWRGLLHPRRERHSERSCKPVVRGSNRSP